MKNKSKIPIYNETESFGNSKFPDFYISKYIDRQDENLNRIDSHRHTYFEVIYVTKGSGIHTIDFTDYAFVGPCLFLLHPQNIHKVHKDVASMGGVVKFTNDFFYFDNQNTEFLDIYGIFDDVDVLPVINLTSTEANEIENVFSLLHHEYLSAGSASQTIIVSLLKVFLLKIFEIKKKNLKPELLKSSNFQTFKLFKKNLEAKFNQNHEVNFYATQLNISTKSLTHFCTKIVGKTASQVIKERILLEAKRLLRFSNLSVKEISYHLGFEDEAYFIRFFSKNIGISPITFRKNNLIS